MSEANNKSLFNHLSIIVGETSTHVVAAGNPLSSNVLLFLHGWPEDWTTFEKVMELASQDTYAIAIDLPGIGGSYAALESASKSFIGRHIVKLIDCLQLRNVTVVGHDVGGQIAYACLRAASGAIKSIVIMSVAVPGLEPWSEVLRNPYIWHFAFHSIPELPEKMVAGKQVEYFSYFYDTIAAHPEAISEQARRHYAEAYQTSLALKTGFDWYRAFSQDAQENSQNTSPIETPLLYIRGEKEGGNIAQYIKGFQNAGIINVASKLIPDSGHFTPEEQPDAVWEAVSSFIKAN